MDLNGKRVCAAPNVLIREMQGEAVLLNLDREVYYGLDAVGTHMWTVLTQASSFEEALSALTDEYEVEAIELEADLRRFVDELRDAGLVDVHDP